MFFKKALDAVVESSVCQKLVIHLQKKLAYQLCFRNTAVRIVMRQIFDIL